MMSYTSADVVANSGITYRQLDYWERRGLIAPATKAGGSGTQREWSSDEVAVICAAKQLIDVGFDPERALKIARTGERKIFLGHGITIIIEPEIKRASPSSV